MSNSLFAPITKGLRAFQERGLKGALAQIYQIGDLKFGTLRGTDNFGNKYYENHDYPYGQHRWVEYSDPHNFDPTMIQPEWHGWMTHMFDETPEEYKLKTGSSIHTQPDAIYDSHLGLARGMAIPQVNTSQYRQRGWGIGSLRTAPFEKDNYYLQPSHPLSPTTNKGSRFNDLKGLEETEWTPADEEFSELRGFSVPEKKKPLKK